MLDNDPIAALIAAERLPPAYAATVDRCWRPLATTLAARHRALGRPLLVGINGAQGSGKSTLCRFVEALLAARGLAVATLSLDDLYLTRADRLRLAAAVHPLFATRGVPGTHDLALAERIIGALLGGRGDVAIPRFDKARDDRAPPAAWPRVAAPLDILLFEGWCIGATPQPKSALAAPINALEAAEDPETTWRAQVNTALGAGYARLFARLDRIVWLRAPDFGAVRDWRRLQEAKLRARAGPAAGMDDAELDRFIAHFERLTQALATKVPAAGDIVFDVGRDHRVSPAGAAPGAPGPR